MPFRSLQGRSLVDQAFDQLAAEVMAERYPAGSSLPSERALAEMLGVNRQVVREALKRLEHLRLVRIAHGGATKVLDFKKHAGVELLATLAEHARGGEEVARVWLSVLEMRAALGLDMARLAAKRASPEDKERLLALSDEMRAVAAQRAGDKEALFALEVRFWEQLVDATGNVAYRLALNTLVQGAYVLGAQALDYFVEEVKASDYRRRIAEAIAAGNPTAAEAEARAAMQPPVETLGDALSAGGMLGPARPRR